MIYFEVSGHIELLDYENYDERTWTIYSSCQSVRIRSTMLKTEKGYDFVTIGNTKFSGRDQIDTIQSSNFTVGFYSDEGKTDKGFVLNWNCLTVSTWTEWETTDDGTCREFIKLQPEYTGPDLKHRTKYRRNNKTCRELIMNHIKFFLPKI